MCCRRNHSRCAEIAAQFRENLAKRCTSIDYRREHQDGISSWSSRSVIQAFATGSQHCVVVAFVRSIESDPQSQL